MVSISKGEGYLNSSQSLGHFVWHWGRQCTLYYSLDWLELLYCCTLYIFFWRLASAWGSGYLVLTKFWILSWTSNVLFFGALKSQIRPIIRGPDLPDAGLKHGQQLCQFHSNKIKWPPKAAPLFFSNHQIYRKMTSLESSSSGWLAVWPYTNTHY